MQLKFTKMQGAGNDYIYLDCRQSGVPAEAGRWAAELSRRRFFGGSGRADLHYAAPAGGR